jgi:hypothetical protein
MDGRHPESLQAAERAARARLRPPATHTRPQQVAPDANGDPPRAKTPARAQPKGCIFSRRRSQFSARANTNPRTAAPAPNTRPQTVTDESRLVS